MFPIIKPSKQALSKRKPIFGAGINDADYVTTPKINGKQITCPYYERWKKVIAREFSCTFHESNPTYKNCTVHPEWLYFSKFKSWMETQDWEGKELDKDVIFPGNKHYSPDLCCFITSALNKLMTDTSSRRGEFPQGVCWDTRRQKLLSQVRYCGQKIYLGHFTDINKASDTYINAKVKIILESSSKQSDPRVANGLRLHADILLEGLSG